jgi:hypothetical protein
MRAWLLLSLILGVVLYLAYRTMRRKDSDVVAEADRLARQEWAELQKRGFWTHVLSRHAKFFFVLYLTGAVVKAWRTTGRLVPELDLLAVYGVIALGLTLFTGWLDWRAAAERFAAAQQRARAADGSVA